MEWEETLGAPVGLRVRRIDVSGEEMFVLSYDLVDPELPSCLTRAEAAVARLLLRGASMTEIALARSASPRTVANQVRAVYKKMHVQCRIELCVLLRSRAELAQESIEAWHRVTTGSWRIEKCTEKNGTRFMLARWARVPVPLMSVREHRVLALRARACSIKWIACELGMSIASVSRAIASGLKKLRLTSCSDLRFFTVSPMEIDCRKRHPMDAA